MPAAVAVAGGDVILHLQAHDQGTPDPKGATNRVPQLVCLRLHATSCVLLAKGFTTIPTSWRLSCTQQAPKGWDAGLEASTEGAEPQQEAQRPRLQ